MRPRKTILLVCANEVSASVLSYQMDIWRYDVTVQHDHQAVRKQVKQHAYDIVLLVPKVNEYSWPGFAELAEDINKVQLYRHQVCRILDSLGLLTVGLAPNVARITTYEGGSARLRDELKTAAAKKRGPKKPFVLEVAA